MTSLPRSVQNGNSLETGSRLVVARGQGRGRTGTGSSKVSFQGDEGVQGLGSAGGCTHCEGAECRPTVHCNAVR